MNALPDFLPVDSHDPIDEHEIKLRVEPRSPLAAVAQRIEELAAEDGNAAHEMAISSAAETRGSPSLPSYRSSSDLRSASPRCARRRA
jgi:hypothetical protein